MYLYRAVDGQGNTVEFFLSRARGIAAAKAFFRKALKHHRELLRCHYNFLRPHRALKFGREVRTPAMQAGLTQKRLTFRDVFTSVPNFLCLVRTVCVFIFEANSPGREDSAISEAA